MKPRKKFRRSRSLHKKPRTKPTAAGDTAAAAPSHPCANKSNRPAQSPSGPVQRSPLQIIADIQERLRADSKDLTLQVELLGVVTAYMKEPVESNSPNHDGLRYVT